MKLKTGGNVASFYCPGCKKRHNVNIGNGSPHWNYSGGVHNPTLSPSILVTSGHYDSNFKPGVDTCWCDYNKKHPDSKFKCVRCHSFVRSGTIQFLADSTHALSGCTVDLPDVA